MEDPLQKALLITNQKKIGVIRNFRSDITIITNQNI